MRRWDLLLGLAVLLLVVAAAGVDWRLGLLVAGLALGGAWYWLEDVPDDDREG